MPLLDDLFAVGLSRSRSLAHHCLCFLHHTRVVIHGIHHGDSRSSKSGKSMAESGKVVVTDIPGLLALYGDGSVDRTSLGGDPLPPSLDFVHGVASKDLVINSLTGLWIRIYLPCSVASSSDHLKVPLVVYFHGGGMCLGSPADPLFHNFSHRMASKSRSVWVSVGYRLSPEHRLPTQYEDCCEALAWLQAQFKHTAQEEEPWIVQHVDCSNLFCAGESAGATILHYVAVRLSKSDWSPLKVRGLMFVDIGNLGDPLHAVKPSVANHLATAERLRTFIKLALPDGAEVGDPIIYCSHPSSLSLSQTPFPPALVTVAERDLLCEGGLEYYQALMEAGMNAELLLAEGEDHCFHLMQPESEAAEFREGKLIQFMQKLVQSVEKAN